MYQVKINDQDHFCPSSMADVTVERFMQYLDLSGLAPGEVVRLKQVSRSGVMGWLKDTFTGKAITTDATADTLSAWDAYNRMEVGFWYGISPGTLKTISDTDIVKLHTWVVSCLKFPEWEPGRNSFTYQGKVWTIGIDLKEKKRAVSPNILEFLHMALLDEAGSRAESPDYFCGFTMADTFQALTEYQDRAGVITSYIGKVIKDSVLYKKGKISDLTQKYAGYFPAQTV